MINYKNWKVSIICLKQLKNHELDWVVTADISVLPEDASACAMGRRVKWMSIPFEMPRSRLRDSIKTDLKEIG